MTNPINKPGASKGKKGNGGGAQSVAEPGSNYTVAASGSAPSATAKAMEAPGEAEEIATSTLGLVPSLTAASSPAILKPSGVVRVARSSLDVDLEQYRRFLSEPDPYNEHVDRRLKQEVEQQVEGYTFTETIRTRKTSAYWLRYHADANLPPGPFQQMNLDAKAHRPNYRKQPVRSQRNMFSRWGWN